MDTYTLFLFLGLTLMGGTIAFMGDRLGRYMGKRRMTVFGLRPRHTALFFTIIAGMFIALTSLAMMSLVSTNVRRAVFHVGTLVRDRERLTAQNSQLRQERDRLQQVHDLAKARAAQARAEEAEARAELAKTKERLEQAQREAFQRVALLEREAVRQSRAAAQKSAEVRRLSHRLAALRNDFERVSHRLATVQQRQRQAETDAREAAARYEAASRQCQTVSAELRQTEDLLAAAREHLRLAEAQRDTLRQEVADLMQQVEAANAQIQALAKEKADLEQARETLLASREGLLAELAHLRTEKERLAQEKIALASQHQALRSNEVLFELGEELAWEVIDGQKGRPHIRERLQDLVDKARQVVFQRGAGPKEQAGPALRVIREASAPNAASRPVTLTDEHALDLAADEIARARTSVVAQIVVHQNAMAGETVVGYLNTWVNRLVFRQGEEIAKAHFPPRQSVARILEDLMALLQRDVRAEAVRRGLIPRPVAPGIEGALHVGQVPLTDLLAAAEKAHRASHGATVEVLAGADLWTADSMRVSFRVIPWPAPLDMPPSGSILSIR